MTLSTDFRVFGVGLALVRSLRGPVARVRRQNRKLADQLVTAASSVTANLAEGNRRTGRDRLHHFRIAAGSADETRGHLLTCEAWGWLHRDDIAEALDHADHILAITWKLTR